MFFTTDDPITEMDLEFFKSFDPFSHFVAAELVNTGNFDNFSAEFETGEPATLTDALTRASERVGSLQQVLTRVMRYFASETLMLLVLAAPPHGPFFRVSSVIRGKKLNQVFATLAKRQIPKEFRLKANKIDVEDFPDWLGLKLFRDQGFFGDPDAQSLLDLIVEEAELVSSRSAINAFKHCRPLNMGQSLAGKISVPREKGDATATITPVEGIQWVDWKSDVDGGFSVRTETEEFDFEYDKTRLVQVCLIMDSIRNVRIAQLEGKSAGEIILPTVLELNGKLRRSHHQTHFGGKQ